MFHSTKALLILSTLLIVSCATGPSEKTLAGEVDISGFEEMTPDEFLELAAGKTFTGVHRGNEYTESYTQDKRINGIWGGEPYSGRWTSGENNCVLQIIDMGGGTTCWKLLHKEGKYIFGRYNSDGTILTMSHYVTLTD
jgi:hypothetical protein